MHCPNCGQQQVSADIKFCSRCGFPLGLVSELLAHGGFLPQLADLYKKRTIFTRRNGVIFSLLWCLFFLLIMAPLWGIVDVDELAAASAVIGIFGGLIFLIASLTLLKKPAPVIDLLPAGQQTPAPATLYARPERSALPPQQTTPASEYVSPPAGKWRGDTNELKTPASVTEETTKLLHKEQDQ